MRNVAKPYFKPSFTDGWWTDHWIRQAVDELFDRVTAKDHADLNLELCALLPMSVITIGFGLPRAEAVSFRKALHDVLTARKDPARAVEAHHEIEQLLRGLMEARRAAPKDDLVSRMVHADYEVEGGGTRKLTNDEVMRYCMLIIHAGGGTTWRQLGTTIKALLDHPDQLEALRKDRSLLRPTIQESARWRPTDLIFSRWVEHDTELEGVPIKADSVVQVSIGTANRDPAHWTDPDSFDIHRPLKRNFAFGGGIHACLGQHLSRQEMEVALTALLDRLPNLRWDPDKPRSRHAGGSLIGRGPDALHVRFDRPA
jgi:cytochrome P450